MVLELLIAPPFFKPSARAQVSCVASQLLIYQLLVFLYVDLTEPYPRRFVWGRRGAGNAISKEPDRQQYKETENPQAKCRFYLFNIICWPSSALIVDTRERQRFSFGSADDLGVKET